MDCLGPACISDYNYAGGKLAKLETDEKINLVTAKLQEAIKAQPKFSGNFWVGARLNKTHPWRWNPDIGKGTLPLI